VTHAIGNRTTLIPVYQRKPHRPHVNVHACPGASISPLPVAIPPHAFPTKELNIPHSSISTQADQLPTSSPSRATKHNWPIHTTHAMSDLAKHFAKTKLSSLPPPEPLTEEPPEYEDDSSSASSMSSTGTVIPTSTQRPAPAIHWSDYFAQEFYMEEDLAGGGRAKFHVYVTPPATSKAPLVVLHHGAGSSAMSFALMAKEIKKGMPELGILAVEARDHGSVVWDAEGNIDNNLSVENLTQDLNDMLQLVEAKLGWTELPTIVLVGHSLGGAVVTHMANSGLLNKYLLGYAVLDVVEGSAMEALKHMQTYLASRPKHFPSLPAAVEWHIRSRTLRNPQSARASVPSLLLQGSDGRWAWRTELGSTEAYWENWFTGMSDKFLKGRGAKLLILAGTDRLDKELMIGQMQGMVPGVIVSASMESNMLQVNSKCRSSLMQAISSTKTSRKKPRRSLSSSSSATIAVRLCFRQRCQTFLDRARRSESWSAFPSTNAVNSTTAMQRAYVCIIISHSHSMFLPSPCFLSFTTNDILVWVSFSIASSSSLLRHGV
jgi:protein phosphatase methylesterase 1